MRSGGFSSKLHTIRHVINDDAKWLSILRGLSADFWHQTVTTEQVESYISTKAGIDFSKVFYFDFLSDQLRIRTIVI